MILMNIAIMVMVLDSMSVHIFHDQKVIGVRIMLFLELIIVLLCMLILEKDILVFGNS